MITKSTDVVLCNIEDNLYNSHVDVVAPTAKFDMVSLPVELIINKI